MKHNYLAGLFKLAVAITLISMLVGCAAPQQAPVTVKETVIVEKEKQLEVTKVVEKMVTVAPELSEVSPPGSLPIVKEPLTLKILVNTSGGTTDYATDPYWKWFQEKTGVTLEFIVLPSQDAQQKFNLMLASGDLPDIIALRSFIIPLDQQQVMADQELIIPLNDLIDQYGFYSKQLLKDHPEVQTTMALNDGNMYMLPNYADVFHVQFSQKFFIYKPWLDKLGLKVPTTTEEYYEALKAFKTKDPNGNGKADEVPMSCANNWWNSEIDPFLMNPFVLNNTMDRNGTRSLFLKDGKIQAAFADPGWKEGLKYLNKLYSEGLIDQQCLTNNFEQLQKLGTSEEVILGSAGGGGVFWTNWLGADGRWKGYVPVPPLKGPSGLQQIPYNIYQPIELQGWMVSKTTKHPEVAFRLGDFMYSQEATMNNAWGMEGQCWRKPKTGELGIGGGPALYVPLPTCIMDNGAGIYNGQPTYQSSAFRLGVADNPDNPTEKLLYDWSLNVYAPYAVKDQIVPTALLFTPEEATSMSEIRPALYNIVDESMAGFVTGQMSIDNEWDTYLQRLQEAGLDKFLANFQAAYERKYK
ncbi:MAG: extracellular solute-binding protein [Anaerolineaceae bacterium]|nr:extracellular solute-binding protein [Anaerolineaceae bacterium]